MIAKWLLDPTKITNHKATDIELELLLLFWVCASGKNGVTAAKSLNKLLTSMSEYYSSNSPFGLIRSALEDGVDLAEWMRLSGIGCYNHKAKSFREIVSKNLNLRTCTISELESIYGIGMKTARCFLIHSRKDASYAGLDRHILRFLESLGHKIQGTLTKKEYLRLEKIFVDYQQQYHRGKSIAELDLEIWMSGRSKKENF